MKIEYPNIENISLAEHYKKLFASYHARSRNPTLVMQWSAKSVSGSPLEALLFRYFAASVALGFVSFIAFLYWDVLDEDPEIIYSFATVLGLFSFSVVMAREVKAVYRYRVFETHARLAYCLDIPKQASTVFKGFAISGIACIFLIGLMSGSILILVGPCGIAVFAALMLLNMKNPRKRKWSAPWDEYNYVTVDRKRRFIVTHVSDQTLGFEARLPNDELFEQYLAFLHSVLPASAQFIEKKWNLSLI